MMRMAARVTMASETSWMMFQPCFLAVASVLPGWAGWRREGTVPAFRISLHAAQRSYGASDEV
jgi:hypothetical protein